MAKKDKNRPPFWRFRARNKYDMMHMPWREYKARILTPEEADKFDVDVPLSWGGKTVDWVFKTLGLRDGTSLPAGSGAGVVQSPYVDTYTRTYGVAPISDLPKYRTMIRNQPDIQAAIELQITMAVGKGFVIEHPKVKIKKYLNKLSDRINLLQSMMVMGNDMLGYGNAYSEIQWSDVKVDEEQVFKKDETLVVPSEITRYGINRNRITAVTDSENSGRGYIAKVIKRQPKVTKKKKKVTILGLKGLDPIYMRVRRDSWGNVYGYAQWMTAPPIFLDVGNTIHIKYRPKSTGYESAYGTSILLALIKNNSLLTQFENDAATWLHSRAVPPLIVKGGKDPEHPYTTAQMKSLLSALGARTAASMIGVKSDVQVDEIEGAARNLNLGWWLQYLLTRRYQALGVPPVLMGAPEGTNRATGEIVFQDFITRVQIIQHLIADAIETQVLWPLIKANFGEDIEKPKIVWGPIVEEDRNMRTQRLVQAQQLGALSINEFRQAIGYPRIDKRPDLDKVVGKPSGGGMGIMPSGDPRKTKPQKPGDIGKPPPEGVKKKEGNLEEQIRVKKIKLLVSQETLKDELLGLVETAKFEFKQGDRKVQDVKEEMMKRGKDIINKEIVNVYLYGKMDSVYSRKQDSDDPITIDDLSVDKSDLPKIADLKKKYIKNFEKIITDMVKAKEEGLL